MTDEDKELSDRLISFWRTVHLSQAESTQVKKNNARWDSLPTSYSLSHCGNRCSIEIKFKRYNGISFGIYKFVSKDWSAELRISFRNVHIDYWARNSLVVGDVKKIKVTGRENLARDLMLMKMAAL